jgi:hypothetical protein
LINHPDEIEKKKHFIGQADTPQYHLPELRGRHGHTRTLISRRLTQIGADGGKAKERLLTTNFTNDTNKRMEPGAKTLRNISGQKSDLSLKIISDKYPSIGKIIEAKMIKRQKMEGRGQESLILQKATK